MTHERVESGEIRKKIFKCLQELDSLPSLPEVVNKVVRAVEDPDTSADDIARIMRDDPAMTAKVLKIANSTFYGVPNREITSVPFAISRMGFFEIKKIAFSMGVLMLFRQSAKVIDHKEFWRHCIATAIGTTTLNRFVGGRFRVSDSDLSAYFVGGLLHKIGMLMLEAYFHEAYTGVIEICRKKYMNLPGVEDQVFGITHAEVGHFLCRKWNLPETVTAGVLYYASINKAPTTHFPVVCHIAIAEFLARQLIGGFGIGPLTGNRLDDFPSAAWRSLELPRRDLVEIMRIMNEECGRSEVFVALAD